MTTLDFIKNNAGKFSGILGSLAATSLSNLYYPKVNRSGVAVTFEGAALGIGFTAVQNLFQEFLVRKLTPHTHPPKPTR